MQLQNVAPVKSELNLYADNISAKLSDKSVLTGFCHQPYLVSMAKL